MASTQGLLNQSASLVRSKPTMPEPAKPTPDIDQAQERKQHDVDQRESIAESAIIPRELLCDFPPPVPPKNTSPVSQTSSTSDEPIQTATQVTLQRLGGQDHEQQQQLLNRCISGPVRPTSTLSSEIKILFPGATPTAENRGKTPKPSRPNYVLHPLMISPPSPIPEEVLQMPTIPKRPFRPSSLRLPSSLARVKELTTDVVVVLAPDRPETAESYQTQPHTGFTASNRIKYGRGKHSSVELVPQPSDDPRDPLNWPTWRKELHLYALLVSVALCNVMKTALVSVNVNIAERLEVSYVAVSALTGVPLILSAATGLASCTASKVWGRRPIYLVSMVLIFIGLIWNAQITTSYAHFMTARIFQGLGWGAFDTMVMSSVTETYFEHQRSSKTAIHRIVSVATTWGPPLLGGLISQSNSGPNLQFKILAFFQILSIPLLVLGAPESMYDRSVGLLEKPASGWTPRSGWSTLGLQSSRRFQRLPSWARIRGTNVEKAVQYVKDVAPPKSYAPTAGRLVDKPLLLQSTRALVAPTTVLSCLASLLPYSLLWGFSSSLSGLFAHEPFNLFPATVGALLATTFALSTITVAASCLSPTWSTTHKSFKPKSSHPVVLAGGAALFFTGTLAFILYVSQRLLHGRNHGFSFIALSFVLGLLAAGAYVLDVPRVPLIRRSAQFSAPTLAVSLRNEADMDAGVSTWRTLFAGVFVMATPAAVVVSSMGLRNVGAGVLVVQVLVAGAVGTVWYMYDEGVRRLDGRVLGCVGSEFQLSPKSYFDD